MDTIKKNTEDGTKDVNVYSILKFVGTMNFMLTSLEKLVKNLDRSKFKHTSKYFEE